MYKNKFSKKPILTVHDNLLSDLYSLTLDTVRVSKIDNEYYLINQVNGRNYQIGLRARIPDDLLPANKEYNDLLKDEQDLIFDSLKERLFFSNVEILLTNILLSKYLNMNQEEFDISFMEIEACYRKCTKNTRAQVSSYSYTRYIETVNSLVDKEIFLETNGSFRDNQYGVNNLNFHQQFLTIIYSYPYKKNNQVFSYTFGRFGEVLKLSRRYSTIIPPVAYTYRLNQGMLHSIYYFLGKEIFWKKYCFKKKYGRNVLKPFELDIRKLLQLVHYDTKSSGAVGYSVAQKLDGFKSQPNKNRTYRKFIADIEKALICFKADGIIEDYAMDFIVNESEEFEAKHEFDYDILGNLKYIIGIDDINQDVDVEFTIYIRSLE